MQAAETILTLFLVLLAGVIARRLKIMSDDMIHGTSRLVMEITLPCLTVYSMTRQRFDPEILRDFALTLVISLAVIGLSVALGWFLFRKRERGRRVILACFCGLSNCGFMGYPVIQALRPEWMIYAVAFNISYGVIAWTVCVGLFAGQGSHVNLKKALLNINILASLVGFFLFCLNFHWEGVTWLEKTLDTVGGLTTPLSMLVIGARLTSFRPADLKDRDIHLIAILRNLLLPLAVYGLMLLLPVSGDIRAVMLILTAMPLGTMVSMFAELYRGDGDFAARAVGWSTLLSLGTIPLIMLLIPSAP